MKKCFNIGALALLGALTFKLFLWPICCCANAAPTLRSLAFTQNTQNYQKHQLDSTSMEFIDTNLKDLRQTSSVYDIFLENAKNNSSAQKLSNNFTRNKSKRVKEMRSKKLSTLERNERSANLSHISGSARKIQLYIKNRFLQLLPDGVVNGTSDYQSDFSVLQRTTVNVGQIKIQGVATCLFLCMDNCGMAYGSAEFTDDCVFNESIEQHHYNTYSSTYNSNAKRTFYLGLNRHGQPRKIQIPTSRQLGKLSTYTKSLTQTVSQDRVDQLIARLYGQNHLRHGLKQLCDVAGKSLQSHHDIKKRKNKLKCNNLGKVNKANGGNGKKKKKKRKCRDDETDNDQCLINQSSSNSTLASVNNFKNNFQTTHSNRRKSNNGQKICDRDDCNNNNNNKKNNNNSNKKKLPKKNNHSKFNNQSISNHKQQKSNHKIKTTKINSKDIVTTLRPDEIDHDIVDLTNGSDEFNEEDEYEEFALGHIANLIDESYFDEN